MTGHERGWCAILKAVLRLCPAREKFLPFGYRPKVGLKEHIER